MLHRYSSFYHICIFSQEFSCESDLDAGTDACLPVQDSYILVGYGRIFRINLLYLWHL